MTRLEPFDDVARLPMPKVSAHLENMSSFSAIKLDIWEHKTGQIQGFEAITAGFRQPVKPAGEPDNTRRVHNSLHRTEIVIQPVERFFHYG